MVSNVRYRLRTLLLLVTIAACLACYLLPSPDGSQVAAALLKADESQIRSLMRKHFKKLDEAELSICLNILDSEANKDANEGDRSKMVARLTAEEKASVNLDDPDDLVLPIKGSRISHIYRGCKQWAQEHPDEILPFVRQQMHEKEVGDLLGCDNGGCACAATVAIQLGFAEGIVEHDITEAFKIPSMFSWHYEHGGEVVYAALYPAIRKREFSSVLRWFEGLPANEIWGGEIVLSEIERRMRSEDVDQYIAWVENNLETDFLSPDRIAAVASVDRSRAVAWIGKLQSIRDKTIPPPPPGDMGEEENWTKPERLLGTTENDNAYIAFANSFKGAPLQFVIWADGQLRETPTKYLHSSWHGAIAKVVWWWPEEDPDLGKVEPLLFRFDQEIVNYPAIRRYLQQLPLRDSIALADEWLENETLSETQREDLAKAFGAALFDRRPERAKEILSSIRDQELRARYLEQPKYSEKTWYEHGQWEHDVGLRKKW